MTTRLDELRGLAVARLVNVADGEPLDTLSAALVDLGVKAAVTALDAQSMDDAIEAAAAAGASAAQLEETVALVAGLGVHSLMATAPRILRVIRSRGLGAPEGPLDAARQQLWDRYVGADPFWNSFERHLPGFLDALLRLSPETFRAFFDFCAVPWRGGAVRARTKELIAMATDATPAHRFVPGFCLHLENALKLGAGRRAILGALDIAAACPSHAGYGHAGYGHAGYGHAG